MEFGISKIKALYFLVRSLFYPIVKYIKYTIKAADYKQKNPSLTINGYVELYNVKLGSFNSINDKVILSDTILGDYTYIGKNSYIKETSIGKFTCIASNVKIGLGAHPVKDFISIHPVFYAKKTPNNITFSDGNYFNEYNNTIIGNDVWIGSDVIIPGGITIGDGAIIASGAVITKNVNPYEVVGGVPGKFIKYRFKPNEIEELLEIKWWDKDVEWLKKNFKKMHNVKNVSEFIQ